MLIEYHVRDLGIKSPKAVRWKTCAQARNKDLPYLDIKSCIVYFFELSPIMELLLIPQSLILLNIKVIHAWLTNFVVGGTSFHHVSLVFVIQGKVEIP